MHSKLCWQCLRIEASYGNMIVLPVVYLFEDEQELQVRLLERINQNQAYGG